MESDLLALNVLMSVMLVGLLGLVVRMARRRRPPV
jgi:hypothetical protein